MPATHFHYESYRYGPSSFQTTGIQMYDRMTKFQPSTFLSTTGHWLNSLYIYLYHCMLVCLNCERNLDGLNFRISKHIQSVLVLTSTKQFLMSDPHLLLWHSFTCVWKSLLINNLTESMLLYDDLKWFYTISKDALI